MRCNKSCPLYPQERPKKQTSAKHHVRFTPESGHVRFTRQCLLWAISGHREIYFGGVYGSGVPGAIGGNFFKLCSNSVRIFRAGSVIQELRSSVAGYSSFGSV